MDALSKRTRYARNALHEENSLARQLEAKGKRIIRLNQGDPPLYFPTPKHIIDAYVGALRAGKTNYANFSGEPVLKEAVAKRYRRHGMHLSKEDIIVTAGVSEALQFLNQSLIDEGDGAILFKPYYTVYVPHLRLAGGIPIFENYDEKDSWNIEVDHVRKSICSLGKSKRIGRVKYMLITNPNNPTGTVLRRSIIKEIIDIANENGIILVSDEIYDEIVYNNAGFTSVGRLAKGVPHIILNGMSKNFDSTGFRIGYAVIPEQDRLSIQLKKAFSNLASVRISCSKPAQIAFAEAMGNEAAHKREVGRMSREIESRVNHAMKLLSENPYLEAVEPNGAFYIFPRIRMERLKIRDDEEFERRLLMEEYVQVVRGSAFGSRNHFRMIALPPKETLALAIKRINRFCKRHAK